MIRSPKETMVPNTVPAAWPSGFSQFAPAAEPFERVGSDVSSASRQELPPKVVQRAPGFRRNAVEVVRDKTSKEH